MTIEGANKLGFKIKWRKGSATWVIYKSGRVVESGFESEKGALDYLEWWLSSEHSKPHPKPVTLAAGRINFH